MIHDFGIVWSERSLLLSGLGNTTILSVLSAAAALLLGFGLTPALMSKQRWLAGSVRGFVDIMRCVPFLLFAYIVYYGLPSFGIRLDNWTSGLLALTIYNAAYMAEILRGAWTAQPREPIEAGVAFGFSNVALFRRIVLPPLLLAAGPVIGNQMIQIIKDSAFLTIIAPPELACGKLDPVAALCAVRGIHHGGVLYWGLSPIEAGVSSIDRLAAARRWSRDGNGGNVLDVAGYRSFRRARSTVRRQLQGWKGRQSACSVRRAGQIDPASLYQLARAPDAGRST